MRPIQPIDIWSGGQQVQANNLDMYVINDNLSTSATFYYQVLSVTYSQDNIMTTQQLAQGNLTMNGTDYDNWNANPDINDAAYTWAAQQLNLTLA
jgi:hypothetical protein